MTDLTTEDLAALDKEAKQGETRTIECATPADHAEVERLYAEGWEFVKAATFRRDGKRIARITLATETEKCPVCYGRGYLRCACWPGDCICGEDDRDCEACFGTGFRDDMEDDFPDAR